MIFLQETFSYGKSETQGTFFANYCRIVPALLKTLIHRFSQFVSNLQVVIYSLYIILILKRFD